jgi:hypothetical protein
VGDIGSVGVSESVMVKLETKHEMNHLLENKENKGDTL